MRPVGEDESVAVGVGGGPVGLLHLQDLVGIGEKVGIEKKIAPNQRIARKTSLEWNPPMLCFATPCRKEWEEKIYGYVQTCRVGFPAVSP